MSKPFALTDNRKQVHLKRFNLFGWTIIAARRTEPCIAELEHLCEKHEAGPPEPSIQGELLPTRSVLEQFQSGPPTSALINATIAHPDPTADLSKYLEKYYSAARTRLL